MAHHYSVSFALGGKRVSVRVKSVLDDDRIALFPSVGEYPIYDHQMYNSFACSAARNRAYIAALNSLAKEQIVLDIGTGRDALWAIASARAGARHVYAVEEMPRVADDARGAVRRSGLDHIVTVISGNSSEITLPERASVCVSEIIGGIASAEGAAATVEDARRRLCGSSATFIPDHVATMVAAVTLQDLWAAEEIALVNDSVSYLRRAFETVGHPFDIRLCMGGAAREVLISTTAEIERLSFNGTTNAEATFEARRSVHMTIAKNAYLYGFLLWPVLWCAPGLEALDTLQTNERSWAPIYAPVSLKGIAVREGDGVEFVFRKRVSDDRVHPDYDVRATVIRSDSSDVDVTWISPHHARWFRRSEVYQNLFPHPLA